MSGSNITDRFPTSAASKPPTPEQRQASNDVLLTILDAAQEVENVVPEGRWKSLALTALEEALMWANKAIYNQKRS